MPVEAFPLPRSSFKLLRLILIGYLHEGGNDRKAAGPSAVGATVGLDPTLVSRNNAFLAAVGLLEKAENRRLRLTEPAVEVARALEYEAMDELQEALHGALGSNDFVQRVLAFVRGRGGVDEEQLASHIARLAGVRRVSEFMTGARALIELITLAGLLVRDGDTFRVSTATARQPVRAPKAVSDQLSGPKVELARGARGGDLTLNVNLTSQDLKSDAAVDALAARIQRLLDKLGSG